MRPPDEGQIRALAQAMHAFYHPGLGDYQRDGLIQLAYDCVKDAEAILRRLPYGWELVVYTNMGGDDERTD